MKTSYIQKLTNIDRTEIKVAIVSFVFVFILFASYMILKPVRDAMPSDWGDVALAIQWTYTFVFSIIVVVIYNFIASRVKISYLVPGVFVFFSLSFIFFYFAYLEILIIPHLGKIFYVWISIFSLFHISVFWGFMTENFKRDQSKRIFGFITTGASIGSIAGPAMVALILNVNITESTILLITSVMLLSVLPLILYLNHGFKKMNSSYVNINDNTNESTKELSSNFLSGFNEFIQHPKLIGIASYIFLYTAIATFFYYIQTNVLENFERGERRQILGVLELITNILTILIGVLGTSRLTTKFGLSSSLSIVPFIIGIIIFSISLHPAAWMVLALQVIRRSGSYAIIRPSREILFTAVDSDARFKTKQFIDVAIYRGGDVFWVWVIAFLGEGFLNLQLTPILIICCVVAIVWGFVGVIVGRKHDSL